MRRREDKAVARALHDETAAGPNSDGCGANVLDRVVRHGRCSGLRPDRGRAPASRRQRLSRPFEAHDPDAFFAGVFTFTCMVAISFLLAFTIATMLDHAKEEEPHETQ